MAAESELTDQELDQIEQRAGEATRGPWFVRRLDDTHAMNLIAVSTEPDSGKSVRWPDFDHSTIVAATLVQEPRYVDIEDDRWDLNAAFIAHARSDVPRLVTEIRRLRAREELGGQAT